VVPPPVAVVLVDVVVVVDVVTGKLRNDVQRFYWEWVVKYAYHWLYQMGATI
jgi:hypothetical protein